MAIYFMMVRVGMSQVWIIPVVLGLFVLPVGVHAETFTQNFEGGMDVEITYPDEIVVGREEMISVLVQNNGWEDKQDIVFDFTFSGTSEFIIEPAEPIIIERLAQGGSFGENIRVQISDSANEGRHFLNLKYSQSLIANNETPQPATFHDIAIPILVKEDPRVTIYTKTPESIFTSAEFPIEVEVISQDIDIANVNIKIIPPADVEFRGETSHTFSKIDKGTPVAFTSRIITPSEEVNTEYKLPFEIIVKYTDDVEEEKTDSQTVSIVLRPRTFMELTTDGGIWIGDFFIAPYVSLGTIIGIPAGTLFSLLIRKKQNSAKRRKRKKKAKDGSS